MSAPDVAAVIRDHATIATGLGEYCCKCSPREWRSIATRSAHVAEALRPIIAAAQAEALREAADDVAYQVRRLEVGCEADAGYYDAHMEIQKHLRDRADRIGGAS